MTFIKTNKARETNPAINLYICLDDISSFFFNQQYTVIHMKNGYRWELEGDMTGSIHKLIQINGKVSTID